MLDLATISTLCVQFTNKAVIVVDEAYIDFAQAPSATTLLSSFDNLIVLRTLSKAYGLAGLRLGTAIAQPHVIKTLQNAMPPYTLSSAVIDLAKRALADKKWFTTAIQRILNERTQLTTELQRSPWIETIYPSRTNFILVSSNYASSLARWFAEHGIAVRHFAGTPLMNKLLRITVGDELQNKRLVTALNSFSTSEE